MRFLIDRCAGSRIAAYLLEQGHDVFQMSERGPDPGDMAILQRAAEDKRILVTMDKDFGRLIYLENRAHSGIIRLPDVPSLRRVEIMKRILDAHSEHLTEGCIITVRGDRIRISFPSAVSLKRNEK
jgi:predicted nuclease of predicted toxin-antitoxin system